MLMREHVSSVKASLIKSLTERSGEQTDPAKPPEQGNRDQHDHRSI
jgi:hypothetical protein